MTEYSRVYVGKTVGGEVLESNRASVWHSTAFLRASTTLVAALWVGNSECEPACVHCLLLSVPLSELL